MMFRNNLHILNIMKSHKINSSKQECSENQHIFHEYVLDFEAFLQKPSAPTLRIKKWLHQVSNHLQKSCVILNFEKNFQCHHPKKNSILTVKAAQMIQNMDLLKNFLNDHSLPLPSFIRKDAENSIQELKKMMQNSQKKNSE